MRNFKLLKFFNGRIHSILRPIFKTWVWFYSLELEEFENAFIVSVFNVFVRYVCLLAHGSRLRIFGVSRKQNNSILQYAVMFIKETIY